MVGCDTLQACHISLRMAFLQALESFLALIGGQLGRTAELHATGLRTGRPVIVAF
jgi:hypothetical protein